MLATEGKNAYKSPIPKLMRFFESSRDGWKTKCREAKALAKDLKNAMGKLRQSRDRWKALTRLYKQRLDAAERELAEKKRMRMILGDGPPQKQRIQSRGN